MMEITEMDELNLNSELLRIFAKFYMMHDRLPTRDQLMSLYSPSAMGLMGSGKKINYFTERINEFLSNLNAAGLITEPGKYTGRCHLTESGRVFLDSIKVKIKKENENHG